VPLVNGKATGEYQDFVTGFVTADGHVWGRPVTVAVSKDGSLMFSDDGTGSIWEVRHGGK
jgi:glucose/arabinose dehydrogenase